MTSGRDLAKAEAVQVGGCRRPASIAAEGGGDVVSDGPQALGGGYPEYISETNSSKLAMPFCGPGGRRLDDGPAVSGGEDAGVVGHEGAPAQAARGR